MKNARRFLALIGLLFLCGWLQAQNSVEDVMSFTKPASTNVPGNDYPRIDAEGRVYFRLHAPNSTNLQVDICGKKYPMVKDEQGFWTATTDPLKGIVLSFL